MSELQRHWFEDLADHMGEAYLRYSFTKGTTNEVDCLFDLLELEPGMLVLDLGCGPGRHCLELARRGVRTMGIDISQRFIQIATAQAEAEGLVELCDFYRFDVHALAAAETGEPIEWGSFDAVIALCQGALGIADPKKHRPVTSPEPNADPFNLGDDVAVLTLARRALKPEGQAAISAFSSYFQARWHEETDDFDPATAINREQTEFRDPSGTVAQGQLWTTCYTPRELAMLCDRADLVPTAIYSVTPGRYEPAEPSLDSPEFLLVATPQP